MYIRIYEYTVSIYMKIQNNSLTSVKVNKELYDEFKVNNIGNRFSLQDLVNRSMYLYLHDADFKSKLYNFIIPVISDNIPETTILNVTGSNSHGEDVVAQGE